MMSAKGTKMKFTQTVSACSVAVALADLSGTVSASGFALLEQSVSGRGALIGNYSNSVDILSVQYTRSF